MNRIRCSFVALLTTTLACSGTGSVADSGWIPLFNGENLDGWRVKIRGHELDDNHADTFRVEDGLLRVVYDDYASFDGKFGHLFFETPFSHYRLRVEYRFVGEQTPGGPGWAFRNSGVMLHGQAPETMTVEQEFPVSIEAQMLGGGGEHERSTGNLCTPGTHVEMNGELVLEYNAPQLDPNDGDARRLLADGAPPLLSSGTISLQAESHPVDFRRVELLPLDR